MGKHLKLVKGAFVVAAFAMLTVPAFAGTLTLTNNAGGTAGPYLQAKEAVEGGTTSAPLAVNIGDKLAGYKPTTIPLGSLSDPVVAIKVDSGKLTVVSNPALCTSIGGTLLATYAAGSGTDTLVLNPVAGQSISNGVTYVFGRAGACAVALAAADVTATVLPGKTSVGVTVTSGTAATQVVHDTATATLVSVAPQFTATVSTSANALIDPAEAFKKFTGAAVTDTIAVTITNDIAKLDSATVAAATDVTTLKFGLTDVTGLAATSVTVAAVPAYTCALDLTTKIATCTSAAAAAATDVPIATFTIDGTSVLAERTFTATAEINFGTAGIQDHTVALNTALLNAADAGKWLYDGTTVYIPLIKTVADGGVETYIKLQTSDVTSGANGINAVILTSDGTLVSADMGAITPGVAKTVTGADLMAKVTAAGKTVDGAAGFAAKLNLYTDQANLYGYANIVDYMGAKRIPLSTTSGVSN